MGITPDLSQETPSQEGVESTPDQTQGQAESILDLDSVERFKFNGQEMTPQELRNAYLRQQDYSRKTQTLAQERKAFEEDRKYSDNFVYDAMKVMRDPSLLQKFAETYPEKYLNVLVDVLQSNGTQTQKVGGTQTPATYDPVLATKLSKMERFIQDAEKKEFETQVKTFETEIDQQISKLSPKYPFADEATVITQAEMFHAKGGELTPENWEKIFKSVNDFHKGRYESHYKKQFESQKQANRQGKDSAPGGGIPSQAPQKMSLKDVGEKWQRDMLAQRGLA